MPDFQSIIRRKFFCQTSKLTRYTAAVCYAHGKGLTKPLIRLCKTKGDNMIIHADPEELVALIERLQGRTGTTVRIPLEVSGDDLGKIVEYTKGDNNGNT